ncbi:hypothetical protein AQUCO_00400596v1 [Aquilegia coerulea]|uniref:Uncharacterized protein n=1 Tax=Aquilegia coerulea TaxID=218851 RepID=A0A2G5EVL8_AQUCA|nr:hypothetical protein AQUCO_00400596v1 [Aquilegia coerulea]
MAQVHSFPIQSLKTLNKNRSSTINSNQSLFLSNNSSISSKDWNSLQLKLKCKGKYTCLFSNNNKEDQARKALEGALGGKKNEFERWNKEIEKREEMGGGGGAGGGGWFGWGRWFGDGEHFWEEAQQASLVVLVLLFVYLVIAKGELLLAVVFNPVLFALRGLRNALTYITSTFLRKGSPVETSIPEFQKEELVSRHSAKENVIRKWASD